LGAIPTAWVRKILEQADNGPVVSVSDYKIDILLDATEAVLGDVLAAIFLALALGDVRTTVGLCHEVVGCLERGSVEYCVSVAPGVGVTVRSLAEVSIEKMAQTYSLQNSLRPHVLFHGFDVAGECNNTRCLR